VRGTWVLYIFYINETEGHEKKPGNGRKTRRRRKRSIREYIINRKIILWSIKSQGISDLYILNTNQNCIKTKHNVTL